MLLLLLRQHMLALVHGEGRTNGSGHCKGVAAAMRMGAIMLVKQKNAGYSFSAHEQVLLLLHYFCGLQFWWL